MLDCLSCVPYSK